MSLDELKISDEVKGNLDKVSIKGHRRLSDVENFYRFVYENKVRKEAHMIFKAILETMDPKRKMNKKVKTKKSVN